MLKYQAIIRDKKCGAKSVKTKARIKAIRYINDSLIRLYTRYCLWNNFVTQYFLLSAIYIALDSNITVNFWRIEVYSKFVCFRSFHEM